VRRRSSENGGEPEKEQFIFHDGLFYAEGRPQLLVCVVPQRIQFSYNGALDNVRIDAIKPIIPYDWVPIGLGMYVYAPRLIA